MRDIVLVVEDDPILRLTALDILEDAGFDTVEAVNATQAVTILETRTDIHLVFTDIDMPDGIDGMKMAAVIRDRWPPIEIVLTSGNVAPDTSSLPARCVFFPKPYRSDEIVKTLRRFADEHGKAS